MDKIIIINANENYEVIISTEEDLEKLFQIISENLKYPEGIKITTRENDLSTLTFSVKPQEKISLSDIKDTLNSISGMCRFKIKIDTNLT